MNSNKPCKIYHKTSCVPVDRKCYRKIHGNVYSEATREAAQRGLFANDK
jgi:hypothetical protein